MTKLHHLRRASIATFTVGLAFLIHASNTVMGHNPTPKLGEVRVGRIRSGSFDDVVLQGEKMDQGGPGSWPPTCRWKCGRCSPCRPVHVPIQPDFSTPLEYYPEAWRCKCANKLFMP